MTKNGGGFQNYKGISDGCFNYVTYLRIDNADSSRVYTTGYYGNTYEIKLNSSSTSASTITRYKYSGSWFFKIVHTFTQYNPPKTFVYATAASDGNLKVGVSLTNRNLMKDDYQAGVPNVINSRWNGSSWEYDFSMNAFRNFEGFNGYIRKTNGQFLNQANCPSGNYYLVIGQYKQCYSSCPSHLKYIVYSNGVKKCTDKCEDGNKTVYGDSSLCLGNDCDDYGSTYLFWGSTSSGICTTSCRDAYSYKDGNICKNECPGFIQRNGAVGSENSEGLCISTCSTSKFRLYTSEYKYPHNNSTIQNFCLDSCDKGNYTKYYISSSIKYCVDDCRWEVATNTIIRNRRYRVLQGSVTQCTAACPTTYVTQVQEWGRDTVGDEYEYGLCIASCDTEYALDSPEFKYYDNSHKIYCLPACDKGGYNRYYRDSTPVKKCVDDCRVEAATNTMIPDRRYRKTDGGMEECVEKCPAPHISQVREWQRDTPGDRFEDGLCVSSCGAEYILESNEFGFYDGSTKTYCLPACDKGIFTKEYPNNGSNYCTNSCLLEDARATLIPNIRYEYSHAGKTHCVSQCPSSHSYISKPELYNTELEYGICITNCNVPYYRLIHPTLYYSDETPKNYCLHVCYLGQFLLYYKWEGEQYCIDSCISPYGKDKRYLFTDSAGLKECVDKCPVTVKSIKHFNTSFEEGICEEDCPDLTMTAPSIPWPDSSSKTYCIDFCRKLTDIQPYSTFERECVANCQDANYRFTMEDETCNQTCGTFILNQVFCVLRCPETEPFSEDQHCVSECSRMKPFLRNFNECSATCPDLKYLDVCVDDCESEALIDFLSNNNRPYSPLPFVLSTRECASSCSEINFKFVNEISKECMPTCPPPCSRQPCIYEDLKYKDANFYCRKECSDPIFPFTDHTSFECLSKCRTERIFVFNSECNQNCPHSHSLVFKKPRCEKAKCESDCSDVDFMCLKECPEDYPLKLKLESYTECVCKCPKFFEEEKQECKLRCDGSLGLVPNQIKNSCLHCYKELDKLFFSAGSCVKSCPPGTTFNQHYVCTPCFDMNLWTNELSECIPFNKCHFLSHFDYERKTCTKCDKEGYMITKRGKVYDCEKTECFGGHLSSTLTQKICIFCEENQFFADPQCLSLCPEELEYSFYTKSCLKCSGNCGCCVNGTCRSRTCQCNSNWLNNQCDIPTEFLKPTSAEIISFLNTRLALNSLAANENQVIHQLSSLYLSQDSSSRRLAIDQAEIQNLMNNITTLILRQRVQYAYQPSLLQTLDALLVISSVYAKKTSNSTVFDKSIKFLFELTNDIQVFNVNMSVVPDFEIVTDASFTGQGFDFSFGRDMAAEKAVNLTTCLKKMKANLGLDENHKFPYRLIKIKVNSENVEKQEDAFTFSESPLVMIWLYSVDGIINISRNCEEKFVDVSFEIELPPMENQSQRINFSNINVFNKEDPFFNDRCVAASDGTDLTISQRKERFFVDSSSLCNETPNQVCTILEVGDEGKAKCTCKGIQNSRKSNIESTFSSYPKSNYILVTCLTVFKGTSFLKNIGFYTIMIPYMIALLLMYYFNRQIDKELTDKRRFRYMRTDIEIFDSSCMDLDVYFSECINLRQRIILFSIQSGKSDDHQFDYSSLPTLPDLDQLSVEEQMIYDNRSVWQYSIDILNKHNALAYTLFSRSLLDPKPFLLLLYVSELNLSVTLNSFFIDDDLVESFNESEDHSLLSSFIEELPKTIWAMLTAKIVMGLLTSFYSFKYRPTRLFIRRLLLTRDDSARKAYNLFLTDHMWRLFALVLISIPFNFFCLYFVVVYAEIYSGSIGIWFNGIMMGLIIDNLFVQGIPVVAMIFGRTLAKSFPSMQFVYKGIIQLKGLISAELLE